MRELINELKELNAGTKDYLNMRLDKIAVTEAVKLIKQRVSDKKLALRLEDDTYYFYTTTC